MINRLIAAIVLGLLLFLLASVGQALLVPAGETDGLAWWFLLVALAIAFFVAFRAPTIRKAWGHLFFLDGLVCCALAVASLFSHASAEELDYPKELMSEAAVRYAIGGALAGYFTIIALLLAASLIAQGLFLLRPRRSRDA